MIFILLSFYLLNNNKMTLYRNLLIFGTTPFGLSIPPELIDEISYRLFAGSQITLQELVSLTEKQLERQLRRDFIRVEPTWNYEDKLLAVINSKTGNLSPEERIISTQSKFYKYMKLTDEKINKLLKSRDIETSSDMENIKRLVVQDILDIKTKTKTKVPYQTILSFLALYPIEYANSYFTLYKYSSYNKYMILSQMIRRGIKISPVRSFKQWKDLGVKINRGEKAISISVPKTHMYEENGETKTWMEFQLKNILFAQSQTSAADSPPILPDNYLSVDKWSIQNLINALEENSDIVLPDNIINMTDVQALDTILKVYLQQTLGLDPLNEEFQAIVWITRSVIMYVLGLSDNPPTQISGYIPYLKPHELRLVSKVIEHMIKSGFVDTY